MGKRGRRQVAALPWRQGEHGVEILLVTTRTSKRWVIPKGWPMEGKADHEAAAIEAYEEAGVKGVADGRILGNYTYEKILQSGKTRAISVRVFALTVQKVLDEWPEMPERQRQWVNQQQALSLIGESGLLPIVEAFAEPGTSPSPNVKHKTGPLARLANWWRNIFR